jgi:hypothetical protein
MNLDGSLIVYSTDTLSKHYCETRASLSYIRIIETLDDRWLYNEERKMILNEYDSREMAMLRFSVNKKNKSKIIESHLYFTCFKLHIG